MRLQKQPLKTQENANSCFVVLFSQVSNRMESQPAEPACLLAEQRPSNELGTMRRVPAYLLDKRNFGSHVSRTDPLRFLAGPLRAGSQNRSY